MEQLDYNLLFRWFVGLSLDAAVWDVTVFTKNRERLIAGDIAAQFMAAVLNQARVKALLSDEHFSVAGTLLEAWASMKSFRPKDGSGAPPAPGRNSPPQRRLGASGIFTARSAATLCLGRFRAWLRHHLRQLGQSDEAKSRKIHANASSRSDSQQPKRELIIAALQNAFHTRYFSATCQDHFH
jgi:Transposase domain (DUF772)